MSITLGRSGITLFKALFYTCFSYLALMVVLGLIYPLTVSYLANIINYDHAHGSLLKDEQGIVLGSSLIGQDYSQDLRFFQARPSASNYNALASGGYNLGPTSDKLEALLKDRASNIKERYNLSNNIPTDMLTASASGLDCHISYQNALAQAPIVAKENGLTLRTVYELINKHTHKEWFLSNDIVNINTLNYDLMKLQEQ